MKLPKDEMDGALPIERILRVLEMNRVSIQEEENGLYLLNKDGVYEIQQFPEIIPRTVTRHLARQFEIDVIDFYYPNRKLN